MYLFATCLGKFSVILVLLSANEVKIVSIAIDVVINCSFNFSNFQLYHFKLLIILFPSVLLHSFNPLDSYIWFELIGSPTDRDVDLIGSVS